LRDALFDKEKMDAQKREQLSQHLGKAANDAGIEEDIWPSEWPNPV